MSIQKIYAIISDNAGMSLKDMKQNLPDNARRAVHILERSLSEAMMEMGSDQREAVVDAALDVAATLEAKR